MRHTYETEIDRRRERAAKEIVAACWGHVKSGEQFSHQDWTFIHNGKQVRAEFKARYNDSLAFFPYPTVYITAHKLEGARFLFWQFKDGIFYVDLEKTKPSKTVEGGRRGERSQLMAHFKTHELREIWDA